MKLVADSHTHSLASGHAYSTIQELAAAARDRGLEMFALTDHGPSLYGAPNLWHFGNLKIVPERIYGVKVLKGAEANIINYDGSIDIPEKYLRRLEFVIASFHEECIAPSEVERHTAAMINVLKNPYVDAVAHPGNPRFQVDIPRVVEAAHEYGKLIELNNHSFAARPGSGENCLSFADECRKKGVSVVCGSDAHISFSIGCMDRVLELLRKSRLPEEQVLCSSAARFEQYLEKRRKRLKNY